MTFPSPRRCSRRGIVKHHFASRLAKSVALTVALGLATATTAAAHECFNASRSDRGNQMAGSKSNAWFTLHVADVIAEEVESGLYDAETGECIIDAYDATGAPASFTIKTRAGKDGVVGGPNAGDGHGIDHVFAAYGDSIIGAYMSCGVEF